ncbi:hypothetical protein M2146_003054 [Lachnospiraceae bacterium PF1-22]|uniref:hypothetical protein n=1 Tax=Ohessyouella blattaphilus TaxID=2949333 RepID=UPI003E1B9B83
MLLSFLFTRAVAYRDSTNLFHLFSLTTDILNGKDTGDFYLLAITGANAGARNEEAPPYNDIVKV